MMKKKKKILIIRFSSFGDVVQCMSTIPLLANKYPAGEIDWLTSSDFSPIVEFDRKVKKVWSFDRKKGLWPLILMGIALSRCRYDMVYDAHRSLRSSIIIILMRLWGSRHILIRRSKERVRRIMLFQLGINTFGIPFKAMESYLAPLGLAEMGPGIYNEKRNWDFSGGEEKIKKLIPSFKNNIILVPSAAHAMKCWPVEHFKKLIVLLDKYQFTVLGGPQDLFCEELAAVDGKRVKNLAGTLSLAESCAVVSLSEFVVTGDTGLLHVADTLKVPTLALIGPSAFGLPSGKHVRALALPIDCRPCSKDGSGKCTNTLYKRCLLELSPFEAAREIKKLYQFT